MDRRTFLIRCAALSAGGVLAATLPSWAQRALEEKTLRFDSDLYRRFTDPASTDRPFVRWWWNGDKVNADELRREWLDGAVSIGVCGATSTPAWLMQQVADRIKEIINPA